MELWSWTLALTKKLIAGFVVGVSVQDLWVAFTIPHSEVPVLTHICRPRTEELSFNAQRRTDEYSERFDC